MPRRRELSAASALPDFGRAAADYGRYRQGFPESFFVRLAPLGAGLPGQQVLDLGTGTGLLARAFARRGCRVVGLDRSLNLVREARAAESPGAAAVRYLVAGAEAIPLPDGRFDIVAAGTCWHWFDRPAVAREARRLLARGGRLVIAHLDWQRRPGNLIDATLALIDRFNPEKPPGDVTFQFPAWLRDLTAAGFARFECFGYVESLPYSHEAWRGRIRASARVGPAMAPDTLEAFDAALARELESLFPDDPLEVEHRIFAVVAWDGR